MNIKQFFSARQFSQSTERTYRFSLTRMKAWLKENGLRLDKLEATQVDDFLSAQKWNHNSRYTAYCGLRSYLRRAYGDSHPALEYRMKRQQSKPQRTLTTTQLQRVIAILQGKTSFDIRNSAIVALMADTGLRSFEMCDLEMRYLDLSENSLLVGVKGGRWEGAVFSDTTKEYLQCWFDIRESVLAKMDVSAPATIFFSIRGTTRGHKLTTSGMRYIMSTLGKRAKLPNGFSPHDMRRTFATLSIRNGANTRLVQKAGRWSSIHMVELYTQAVTASDMAPYFPMSSIRSTY